MQLQPCGFTCSSLRVLDLRRCRCDAPALQQALTQTTQLVVFRASGTLSFVGRSLFFATECACYCRAPAAMEQVLLSLVSFCPAVRTVDLRGATGVKGTSCGPRLCRPLPLLKLSFAGRAGAPAAADRVERVPCHSARRSHHRPVTKIVCFLFEPPLLIYAPIAELTSFKTRSRRSL